MENVTLAVAKSYAEELLMGQGAIQGADGFSPIIVENASNTDEVYKLDITTKDGTFTTTNLIGKQGIQGIQGIQGEQGETGLQGQQGIQGIKGDKGDDGYPFLIYKQYEVGIEEFNEADYPEIGLMFMVHVWEEDKGYPVYRYTADGTDTPYSLVTHMNTEGIKGEKGDKGDTGEQGIAGLDGKDGKDGATYTPSIGEVTTVDDTELASVSISIKEETKEALFNFAIPKGENGKDGKDAEQRVYTDVTQLGLTSPCSVVDIYKALPINSVIICASYGDANHQGGYITDAPAGHGVLEIQKSGYDGCRATMTFTESATISMGYKRKWVAEFATGNIDTNGVKWNEVAYKTVADVGFTTINQTNGLTAPTGITMTDGSKVNYCIRNGICYVHIAFQISSISAKINSWTPIAELPKSVIEAVGAMNCEGNTVPECMPIRVSQAGKLTLMYKGTTTSTSDWWSYSFSYPVTN